MVQARAGKETVVPKTVMATSATSASEVAAHGQSIVKRAKAERETCKRNMTQ